VSGAPIGAYTSGVVRIHGTKALSFYDNGPVNVQQSLSATSWIGVSFDVTQAGRFFGLACYFSAGDIPPRWGIIWDFTNSVLIACHMFNQSAQAATGWRRLWIHPTYRFTVGVNYRVAVLKSANYWRTVNQLAGGGQTINHVHFQNSFQSTALDPVSTAIGTNTNANGVDILYQAD
jgi:hypothetical protein